MTQTTATGRVLSRSSIAFTVLAAVAAGVILWLGRGLTFYVDEWTFIESRSLADVASWWPPNNEHWSTVPTVVYRALVETVGLHSYVPYLAVVVALHLVSCGVLFVLVRRSSGAVIALAGAAVALFFGSGFENLFWGFQIGFLTSTAAGLWALTLLDGAPSRRRAAEVAFLLLVGLMSSGIGLTFTVVLAVEMLLNDRWRRWIALLAIPAAAYGAWFLAYGRAAVGLHGNPFGAEALARLPDYVSRGIVNAAGSFTGTGPYVGITAAVGIGVLAVAIIRREHRLPARATSILVGVVTLYALIALARAHVAWGDAYDSRYTYVSGFLMLIATASLLGQPQWPERRGDRAVMAIGGGALLSLALLFNITLLTAGRDLFAQRAALTRALVTVALEPLPPTVDPDRSLVLVPSPRSIRTIMAKYGSPLEDTLVPDQVPPIPERVMEEARARLLGN